MKSRYLQFKGSIKRRLGIGSGNRSSTSLPDLAQSTGSQSPLPQATRRAVTPLPHSTEADVPNPVSKSSPAPDALSPSVIPSSAYFGQDEPYMGQPYPSTTVPASDNPLVLPTPISEGDHATMSGWPGLDSLLKALDGTVGIFPPFKAAMKEFGELLQIFEVVSKEHNGYIDLHTRLDVLLRDISQHISGMSSPKMTTCMKNLCIGIDTELRIIEQKLSRHTIRRHIEAVEDPDQVMACYQRIQGHLERLSLNANLSIWETLTKLEREAFLRQLSPMTSSVYNSAISQEIQRRPCTTGTREQELTALLEWARKKSGPSIYWMNGMAGTGKTTIAYSLCTELETSAELGASFFCSRLIPECRDVKLIIPALAYQLARFSLPYCCALLKVLESNPDIHTRVLNIQFESLLVGPLSEVKQTLPTDFVVVIDALDECENVDSIGQILDVLLSHTNENALPVRFLLSSRPESEIYTRMMSRVGNNLNARMVLHDLDFRAVNRDIETYLKAELAVVGITHLQLVALAKLCGALFIFASTTARYIKDGLRYMAHEERLNTILGLSSKPTGKRDKEIDKLYTTILQSVFQDDDDDDTIHTRAKAALDAVICAQEPLTVDVLAEFLGEVDGNHVSALLRPLYSVINIADSTGLVTTLHASFPDYMLEKHRSSVFHCHHVSVHSLLAAACFAAISAKRPQFNICGFESSYRRDNDVLVDKERMDYAVLANLAYGCRYWAAHLRLGDASDSMRDLLWDFLSTKLLLWMEVLNVNKDMYRGPGIIQSAEGWSRTSGCATNITELAHDAWRFVTTFASHAVSESTPHIYISMLPFWPDSAPVSKHYSQRTRGALRAHGSAMTRRQLGLLATWSFPDFIRSVCLSPDGNLIAHSLSTSVYIIDGTTGRNVLGPLEHTGEVTDVAFSPDGTLLASGSVDQTIKVWKTNNGELAVGPLTGHTDLVVSIAFSPDGNHVVSGSRDDTIRVWGLDTGRMAVGPFQGQNGGVWSISVSSNGSRVASGHGHGIIDVWGLETGQMLLGPFTEHTECVRSVCFSPDGMRLASGSDDNTIRLWSDPDGQAQAEILEGHSRTVESVAFSPDGKQLVSGSVDHTVRLWDVQGTPQLARVFTGHTQPVSCVRFSSDGARIVSSSGDRTIRVWDARSQGPADTPLEGHTQAVTSVAFSHGGSRIVSGSNDGTVYVWDGQSGEVAVGPMKGHSDWVLSVCISPDESRIASGYKDNTIQLWDAETGQTVTDSLTSHSGHVFSVCFSPDGALLASGSEDKTIWLWNAKSGEPVGDSLTAHTDWVRSVYFSPDSLRLVSGSNDMTILVWDMKTRKPILPPLKGHTDEVWAVCVSPDGTRIASGSNDATVRLWSANDGQSVVGPLLGHTAPVRSVCFSPNSSYVISGSKDKTIRLWDAQSGQAVGSPLVGHTAWVRSVVFFPDGGRIVSGSDDFSIRVWDIADLVQPQEPQDDSHKDTESSHVHQSWVLQDDGWVVDPQLRLLAWVPPDLHASLMSPRNTLLISSKGSVQLGLEPAKLGESWTECYEPAS